MCSSILNDKTEYMFGQLWLVVKGDTLHTRKQSPVALLWKGILKYFSKFFQRESSRDVLTNVPRSIQTTGKVTVFGDFLVRVFPHSDWIGRYQEYTESKCGKMQTRETPNTDNFYEVKFTISRLQFFILFFNNSIDFSLLHLIKKSQKLVKIQK